MSRAQREEQCVHQLMNLLTLLTLIRLLLAVLLTYITQGPPCKYPWKKFFSGSRIRKPYNSPKHVDFQYHQTELKSITISHPLGWLLTNKITSVGKGREKLELLCFADGNVKGFSQCEKWYGNNETKNYHMVQLFHFWVYSQKN